jgi:hypothetical protein
MGDSGGEGAAAMKPEMPQAAAGRMLSLPMELLECYVCGQPLKPPIHKVRTALSRLVSSCLFPMACVYIMYERSVA